MNEKPRVLVCVLCGVERTNWINPDLLMTLLKMSKDTRYDVCFTPVRDGRPWEVARNRTIHLARQIDADWLVSFDNDNFVPGNPLDIIAAAGKDKDVIGMTYGIGGTHEAACAVNGKTAEFSLFPHEPHGVIDGAFREECALGGGVLMIRNTVWKRIPQGPWFRWTSGGGELLADNAGGEDIYFVNLVRRHGFRCWTYTQMLAGHYRTSDLTGMVYTMAQLSEQAKKAKANA